MIAVDTTREMHPSEVRSSMPRPALSIAPSLVALPFIAPGHVAPPLLFLPFAPNEPDTVGRRRALAGKGVLIVEDEMLPALDMEMAIEDEGGLPLGPIQTVEDGLDFVADADRLASIDVAILDVNLHGTEVFPLAAVLRERGVPFLFHTGHASKAELQQRFPGAPVCPKPMMMNQLLDMIGRLVEG